MISIYVTILLWYRLDIITASTQFIAEISWRHLFKWISNRHSLYIDTISNKRQFFYDIDLTSSLYHHNLSQGYRDDICFKGMSNRHSLDIVTMLVISNKIRSIDLTSSLYHHNLSLIWQIWYYKVYVITVSVRKI